MVVKSVRQRNGMFRRGRAVALGRAKSYVYAGIETLTMTRQPTAIQVSSCVGFRLRKLTRRVSQIYDQMLAPLDLTGTQFSLLSNLATHPDQSIGELADRLMMDPTTLTRTLRPLERRKLVVVAASREDRRRRGMALTSAGQALFREAVPLWRKAQARIAELMGERGYESLDKSLDLSLKQLASA